jgi:Zn-dependent protease with chaperone function
VNFFERQRQVKRLSGRLVLLFGLAVIGIVATIDLIALLVFGGFGRPAGELVATVLVTSVIVGSVIGLASLFRSLGLRGGGGGQVARSLGAVPVPADTTDPHLRRLRNVVEEIAIASGTPVPELFVLEGEPGINAFAAGWSASDAAVAVTRGALEQLNRDELQGVIAHEFSHVVNGDMRLNIKLMGLLFGILVLAIVGRILLAARGGKNNPLPLVGLAMLVAGFVGIFIGRIIKAAVSRQREYLADASAVQFTRQTSGLVGALKKIAGVPAGSSLGNARAEDVSHMLFGSGKGFSGLFATHPPLLERIQALEPQTSPADLQQLRQRWSAAPPSGLQEDRALGLAQAAGPGRDRPVPATLLRGDARVPAEPGAVAASVGAMGEETNQRAGAILGQLPEELLARARGAGTVLPLVFGLLLSEHQEVRASQHEVLAARHGPAVADAAGREAGSLSTLHPLLRLPLAEVAFPALRARPRPEQEAVLDTVHALIQADGRLSISEYCLSRLLHEELYEATHHAPPWGRRRYSLPASRGAAATMLALLASAGHRDPGAAEQAFRAGVGRLLPGQQLPYAPPAEGVTALERVWPALDGLNPADKELLLQAMVTVISHDGQMTVAELELLRTICAMLHCPLPPLVEPTGMVTEA